MAETVIVRTPVSRASLALSTLDGHLVKAVVDVERRVMAIGGELHSDEEQALLQEGSRQRDLWGINLYPEETTPEWIEYDSMINLRPSQGNRSRGVDDASLREKIRSVVASLVQG